MRKAFAIINDLISYYLCLVSAYYKIFNILTPAPTRNPNSKAAVTTRLVFVKLAFNWQGLRFVTLLLCVLRPRYIENLNFCISKVANA